MAGLEKLRDVRIPHYIAITKAVTLVATTIALMALSLSLFTSLLEPKITVPLSASLLIPLWLVDRAECYFGRWHIRFGARPTFVGNDC